MTTLTTAPETASPAPAEEATYEHSMDALRHTEDVRNRLCSMIDAVIAAHCAPFRTWLEARDTLAAAAPEEQTERKQEELRAWAEIPSAAILLRSRHMTTVNAALREGNTDIREAIQHNLQWDCDAQERQLGMTRGQELARYARARKKVTSARPTPAHA